MGLAESAKRPADKNRQPPAGPGGAVMKNGRSQY